jgi:L-ascorbate metabolism protein UlaG (beta-lactamase superfamily)
MKATHYGHSCFLLEGQGYSVLIDPYITPNPLASAVDVAGLRPTHILVSHGHADHIADVETIARQSGALVVGCWEVASHFAAKGLTTHPMNTGGSKDFGSFRVKCVQAVHSSSFPDGSYAGSAMGFIIQDERRTVYYSGDTALHSDMKLIGEYFRAHAAFLCLGDNFTMGYEEAIIASDFVKCHQVTGMHFDTFPYIAIDHEKVIAAFTARGKKLRLPSIGESWTI